MPLCDSNLFSQCRNFDLVTSFAKHCDIVTSDSEVLDMFLTDHFLLLLCLHLGVYFFGAGVHSGATLVPSLPTCKNDKDQNKTSEICSYTGDS